MRIPICPRLCHIRGSQGIDGRASAEGAPLFVDPGTVGTAADALIPEAVNPVMIISVVIAVFFIVAIICSLAGIHATIRRYERGTNPGAPP